MVLKSEGLTGVTRLLKVERIVLGIAKESILNSKLKMVENVIENGMKMSTMRALIESEWMWAMGGASGDRPPQFAYQANFAMEALL